MISLRLLFPVAALACSCIVVFILIIKNDLKHLGHSCFDCGDFTAAKKWSGDYLFVLLFVCCCSPLSSSS